MAQQHKSESRKTGSLSASPTPWVLAVLAGVAFLVIFAFIEWSAVDSPLWLQRRAEAAARTGDWASALRHWRAINATNAARAVSYLGEARACLGLGRAAQAELSLRRTINADSSDVEPWRLLLQILRVEDRAVEAQQLGWKAYDQVSPRKRPELLRELTLVLMSELPDELVRTTLQRWVDADSHDLDAQVALWQRIMTQPRPGDLDRPSVLAALEVLLAQQPHHVGAREALVTALADAGEPDRGRTVLDQWPKAKRDARYWRLLGRWELEYEHRPERAKTAFQTALVEVPQDWRSWYRLARAIHILKRDHETRQAAQTVSRIREALDPLVLGPRLEAAFDHLDDVAALHELTTLCQQAGLTRLADAWLAETHQGAPTHSYLRFSLSSQILLSAANQAPSIRFWYTTLTEKSTRGGKESFVEAAKH